MFLLIRGAHPRSKSRADQRAAAPVNVNPHHQGPVALPGELTGDGRIYLVYMVEAGAQPAHYIALDDFAYWLRTKYSLNAQVLPPMWLTPTAYDAERKQYVAELLFDQIKREHPELAADPNAYLFGFTDANMYSAVEKWSGTFTQRDDADRLPSSHPMVCGTWHGGEEGKATASRTPTSRPGCGAFC